MKSPLSCRILTAAIIGCSTLVPAGSAHDAIPLRIEPPFAWNRTDRYEPPDFEAFFPDDAEAGKELDLMLAGNLKVNSVDERLALIRRGLRNTSRHRTTLLGSVGNQYIWNRDAQEPRAIELMYHASASEDGGVAHYALYHGPTVVSERTPNLVRMLMDRYQSLDKQMQGWISSALGWPRDPALTEILYQGVDPNAPFEIRKAAIYYGFGLGAAKTKNILKAKFQVYMSPPFDRTTNGNMRGRILWGVRDHEDDKYYLATLFEEALRDHASLSDEALRQADRAYHQLTGEEPPNAAEYGSRSVYLVMFAAGDSRSVEESKQRVAQRLGESEHVVDTKCVEKDGKIVVMAAVRGSAGMRWLVENLQTKPKMTIYFADLLTRELIDKAEEDMLRDFEKHLPTRPK